MKIHQIAVDDIYIPIPLRKSLNSETADAMAEEILENGLEIPIQVRHDGKRYILIAGIHRLEAAKALGEIKIDAFIVQARKH
ncbi:ParB N-terminal domain-containing protein [Ahrensia kielensis]|uniref:ParB N-terminal domain-containing protein n=1 Tax=Ahrensia kielensis TaxID=76980 RepID=A0ABU9T2N1_9HYPH